MSGEMIYNDQLFFIHFQVLTKLSLYGHNNSKVYASSHWIKTVDIGIQLLLANCWSTISNPICPSVYMVCLALSPMQASLLYTYKLAKLFESWKIIYCFAHRTWFEWALRIWHVSLSLFEICFLTSLLCILLKWFCLHLHPVLKRMSLRDNKRSSSSCPSSRHPPPLPL